MSDGEATLAFQLGAVGLDDPANLCPQFHFALTWEPARKYAADFAFLREKVLVEVDGGIFVYGGHSRGAAYERDRERDAEAMCHGWRVLRVTTGQVESGQALAWIERLVGGEK